MKQFLILISLFVVSSAFSQQNCPCEKALENLITKIESDYPGFEEKTKDSLIYNSLKIQLTVESKNSDNPQCIEVLKKYTTFFKDKHIWILPNEQEIQTKKAENKKPEKLNVDISKFKKRIENSTDKLEGIWKDESYTVGIKKTGQNQYTGFIIESDNPNWKPKEIKFQLNRKSDISYYLSDYSLFKDTFKLYEDCLLYINNLKIPFLKQNMDRRLDSVEINNKINELDGFYFEKLTPKTSMIRLSNFSYPFVERIEKLINKSKSAIENSENLIIDIRNNGGGTDNAYLRLLPFIVTNPIRNIGVERLATQGLIDGVTTYKKGLIQKDPKQNISEIKELDSLTDIYKSKIGEFINLNGETVNIDSIEIASKSPRQIIMLSNNGTGSAAENFLLKAKQSKKVKVLGTPTSGVLDYASAYFFKFGCDNYKLLLPTYRSLRLPAYPIDNIGIQPDIYLDETVEDWVKYAIEYLE